MLRASKLPRIMKTETFFGTEQVIDPLAATNRAHHFFSRIHQLTANKTVTLTPNPPHSQS